MQVIILQKLQVLKIFAHAVGIMQCNQRMQSNLLNSMRVKNMQAFKIYIDGQLVKVIFKDKKASK